MIMFMPICVATRYLLLGTSIRSSLLKLVEKGNNAMFEKNIFYFMRFRIGYYKYMCNTPIITV